MMTPAEKHQLDQVQFELNEQRQRLDALCAQMNQFREEAMALLKAMGGSIVEPISGTESVPLPEVAPVLHPAPETSAPESGPLPAPELKLPGSFNAAPEPIGEVSQSFEIPDISVGWSGGQRRN